MASNNIVREINAFNVTLFVSDMGGTRAAAEALGVSQRTVQRYVTTAKQQVNPSQAVREKIAELGVSNTVDIGVTFSGEVVIGSPPGRERTIDRVYSPQDWEDLSAAAAAGDAERAWSIVAAEYQVSDFHLASGEILIGEE